MVAIDNANEVAVGGSKNTDRADDHLPVHEGMMSRRANGDRGNLSVRLESTVNRKRSALGDSMGKSTGQCCPVNQSITRMRRGDNLRLARM